LLRPCWWHKIEPVVAAPLKYVLVLPTSTPSVDPAATGTPTGAVSKAQQRDFAENEAADFTLQWSGDESRVSLLEAISNQAQNRFGNLQI